MTSQKYEPKVGDIVTRTGDDRHRVTSLYEGGDEVVIQEIGESIDVIGHELSLIERPSIEKAEPVAEWEARADAWHAAALEEVGVQPVQTLIMLRRWKADAEPANSEGQITFSRGMLDSAADALEATLAALKALMKVRPSNWDDDEDPEQAGAWKLAQDALGPPCVNHPDQPSVTNLDSEDLCQECANAWVRGEGQAAAERDAEEATDVG